MTLRLAVDADDDIIKGKAQRWKIELASNEPFGVASLWDTWMDPSTGKVLTSFTILTVNADEHPC
jgi:putative SOS response-associated peptidase YedK